MHARQVGQLHRQELGIVDAGRGRSARGQQAGRDRAARQHPGPHGRHPQPVVKPRLAPRPGGARREPRRLPGVHCRLPAVPVPQPVVKPRLAPRPGGARREPRRLPGVHCRLPAVPVPQPVVKPRLAPRPGGARREPRRLPGVHCRLPAVPVPSASAVQPSTSTPVHSSVRPLGQVTRTRATAAASPRPTSTRGSLAEA